MSLEESCEMLREIKCEEVKIPLPSGGHLAGKWWGDKSTRPFVCLHGYLDNAGSFDRLIPLLPRECSYLAIDFQGHGNSSWLPHGVPYHTYGFLPTLAILMNEFKWEKISIIAHSMGAGIAFVFAAIFPEKVDTLVTIEGFKPLTRDTSQVARMLKSSTDKFLIADQRNQRGSEPPTYTREEMTELLVKGTRGSVTKETASHLLERNISKSKEFPGKFFFSRDSRMKYNLDIGLSQSVSLDLARSIKIPFLVIRAANAYLFEKRIYHEEALEVMRAAPCFEYFVADSSSHHVHLTEPEKVAGKISDFIRKYRLKLSHL